MKTYKYLIFDADHTLLNYIADETNAFRTLYKELGLDYTEALQKESRFVSEDEWTKTGLYDVHNEKIQREYHTLYRAHLVGVFKRIFEKFPCNADPTKVSKRLLELLAREGELFEGTAKTFETLAKTGKYGLCIATNGLSVIQRARLKKLIPLAKAVFISEEMGCIKPLPEFFESMVKTLDADIKDCLMIGDSLLSDVAGASGVGMDSCWYNPSGVKNETAFLPTYEIHTLNELGELLS